MRWATEWTDEFREWWETLAGPDQEKVISQINILARFGPRAGRPTVDSVAESRHSNLKELRVTQTVRVFFVFDPRRVAVLLIGGNKAGKTKRFYRQMIAKADKIYDAHLWRIEKEASGNGA